MSYSKEQLTYIEGVLSKLDTKDILTISAKVLTDHFHKYPDQIAPADFELTVQDWLLKQLKNCPLLPINPRKEFERSCRSRISGAVSAILYRDVRTGEKVTVFAPVRKVRAKYRSGKMIVDRDKASAGECLWYIQLLTNKAVRVLDDYGKLLVKKLKSATVEEAKIAQEYLDELMVVLVGVIKLVMGYTTKGRTIGMLADLADEASRKLREVEGG